MRELTGAVQAGWQVQDGVRGAASRSSRARCAAVGSRTAQRAAAYEHGAVAVFLVPERCGRRAGNAGQAQHAAVQRAEEVDGARSILKQRPVPQ